MHAPFRSEIASKLDRIVAKSISVKHSFLERLENIVAARPAPDALAQALLVGSPARMNNPRQDCQSWIEGSAPIYTALESEKVIIDLHPARDEAEFLKVYRCTPRQLQDLTERFADKIYFNLRSVDRNSSTGEVTGLASYLEGPAMSLVGPALMAAQERNVYVNAERRVALFDILLGRRGAFDEQVETVSASLDAYSEVFAQACERLRGVPHHPANTRAGQPPSAGQLTYRLAYYAAHSTHMPETRSRHVDILFERGAKLDVDGMMEAVSAVNAYHNSYTAPLTGAYGGVYATRRSEMDGLLTGTGVLSTVHDVLGTNLRVRDEEAVVMLCNVVSGALQIRDGQLVENLPLFRLDPVFETMPEERWDALMEGIEKNREVLSRKADFLTNLRNIAVGSDVDRSDDLMSAYRDALGVAAKTCDPDYRNLILGIPECGAETVKDVGLFSLAAMNLCTQGQCSYALAFFGLGVVAKMLATLSGKKYLNLVQGNSACSPAHRAVYDFICDVRQ